MEALKVQTTLRGYRAWVIQRLMERNNEPLADTANYVIARWIDDNAAFLAKFGVTIERYQNEMDAEKVTEFSRTDRR